jgi:sulfate permease, SulP family
MDRHTEATRWYDLPRLMLERGGRLGDWGRSLQQECLRLVGAARSWQIGTRHNWLTDTIAGLVGSIVLIGNIVSFGALMFPGNLGAGIPTAAWAMLIGSCITGLWVALLTSLPPIATGIDSPTGAVLVLLSAAAGHEVLAAGGSPQVAIQTVMLIFTAATVLSGAVFYALGAARLGSYLRFVPYFVVGGFLGATGLLLIAGGIRTTIGHPLALDGLAAWTWVDTLKLASSASVLGVLLALRRWVKSPFAMPAALLVMWLVGLGALRSSGLSGPEHGWYLHSLGTLTAWRPLSAMYTSHLTWPMVIGLTPEMLAVTIVALISLVTKVSTIEVSRQTSGDLDRELRAHGLGSLICAPFGGIISSMQVGTTRLLDLAGSVTRASGVVCALVLGVVGISSIDIPGLIPIPIVAGLVFYLGYSFLMDAFWRPYSQKAWFDLFLAAVIMIICVQYGYLIGVLVGLVCACIFFAVSYARIGVVRRHVSRAQFAGNVDRSEEAARFLRDAGDAIQLYWLSGYIFFGSSEGVFERVRDDIEALRKREVSHVILDFGMVSGADASAIISLAKLRNFCDKQSVTLVYCALSDANKRMFERGGFFGGKSRHQCFSDLSRALTWCENQLLIKANLETDTGIAGFEAWLTQQLGAGVKPSEFLGYLVRKDTKGGETIYHEGEAADSVHLVAAGGLAVHITRENGESVCVRRIARHAVVGEMGFFRHAVRAATVLSEGPVTLFTLTRTAFERMRRERPDLASAFDDFILRILSDRVDFANREIVALSR